MGMLLLLIAIMKLPGVFGYQPYYILSGSMEPQIPTGSVVYVQQVEWEEIHSGDCITFRIGTDTELTATHRVVSIDQEKKEIVTKGDANKTEDIMKVRENMLIGKVVYTLPCAGFGAWFLQTLAGKICCIVIFLMVLVPEKKSRK